MNPNPGGEFTINEGDLITDVSFNLDLGRIPGALELLSLPALRYLQKQCDHIVARQTKIKSAIERRLQELEG
jgi:hypothetical protein